MNHHTNIVGSARSGYIYLVSVLFVSAIAVSVLASYLLLSISSMQSGMTIDRSLQALENANTCIERGLMALLEDSGYAGQQQIALDDGACLILRTGGYGNTDRTLCAEGTNGSHVRRMEVVIERILPDIRVYSWQEVPIISSCSY